MIQGFPVMMAWLRWWQAHRSWITSWLYLLCCLVSGGLFLLIYNNSQNVALYQENVEQSLAHVRSFAPHLPRVRAMGYLTDGVPRLALAGADSYTRAKLRLDVTQFGVLPRMLVDSGRMPWVLGYFQHAQSLKRVMQTYHLRVVADYGQGYVLLQPMTVP